MTPAAASAPAAPTPTSSTPIWQLHRPLRERDNRTTTAVSGNHYDGNNCNNHCNDRNNRHDSRGSDCGMSPISPRTTAAYTAAACTTAATAIISDVGGDSSYYLNATYFCSCHVDRRDDTCDDNHDSKHNDQCDSLP